MSIINNFIARVKGESVTLGIDVGHYSVKMALIHHRLKLHKVLAINETQLNDGVIINGSIHNPEELKNVLTGMIESLPAHVLEYDVAIGLSWSSGVLADCINLKKHDKGSEEQLILFEAGSRPPFDEQDITLDYKVINRDDDRNELEVLLVAAKNQTLSTLAEFFKEINISPFVLDVDVFALLNAVGRVIESRDKEPDVLAILMIGEQRGNITFLKEGRYHSTREISTASVISIMKTICRKVSLTVDEVKQVVFDGMPTEHSDEIKNALGQAIRELGGSIESAAKYFHSLEPGFVIEEVILAGGGALIPGIDQICADRLGVTASILDSFDGIKIDSNLAQGEHMLKPSDRVRFAVALGLAMRKP